MTDITKRFKEYKIISMIKDTSLSDAMKLAEALYAGGIRLINVSQHSENGEQILREFSHSFPQLLCGGGNVQTLEEASKAISAGAKFIFSPLFDPKMVNLAIQEGIPIFPVTTDPFLAINNGLKTISLYPVEKLGGVRFAQSLFDRFGLTSIVAGGITKDTISSYLKTPSIIAATGSWMIDSKKVEQRDFSGITSDCVQLLDDIL